ncbi:unnamed protein product [Didymodactylos carnosus]|uniref:Uncharacterized protein n=1 Tax=Didymodactylos carnosus TaxID=1234261 RepID=A0A814VIR9_9BILA|nr:unnamed protein product [Didymodactylos carnosus]CAF1188967.1 unnamed protein product [Didymodactylos carnosus]CAF3842416.1 unnamed protein product [Didymodactylos carnosus]CAF3953238.1 unnamed protein product [Didymodactylos carnosus]
MKGQYTWGNFIDISRVRTRELPLGASQNFEETSCCHQLFCKICLIKVDNSNCPNCRQTFTAVDAHFARRLIGNLQVSCLNGCGQTVNYSDKETHARYCSKRLFNCPVCENFTNGVKQSFLTHLMSKHENFLIDCIFPVEIPNSSSWLNGVWTGVGYQLNSASTWSIRLTIDENENKYLIEYPSLDGSGEWTVLKKDANDHRYVFHEKIIAGQCTNDGQAIVTKINNKLISFSYFWPSPNDLSAFSTLKKKE